MTRTTEQLRQFYLSGTVSIPPRFPDLAKISFEGGTSRRSQVFVVATQSISPKLTIKRSFFAQDVSSLFIPDETTNVDFERGTWFEGIELEDKIFLSLDKTEIGIIYVRENAQSVLEMQAGLTAAESAEYYPPLPDDRSVNHYNMGSMGKSAGCS